MKKALISVIEPVMHITGWNEDLTPIVAELTDSARVAQVTDAEFEVAEPFFWMNCNDNVVADQFYYNTKTKKIVEMPAIPERPVANTQPQVSGAQTL